VSYQARPIRKDFFYQRIRAITYFLWMKGNMEAVRYALELFGQYPHHRDFVISYYEEAIRNWISDCVKGKGSVLGGGPVPGIKGPQSDLIVKNLIEIRTKLTEEIRDDEHYSDCCNSIRDDLASDLITICDTLLKAWKAELIAGQR
jgi:hypothetical protein